MQHIDSLTLPPPPLSPQPPLTSVNVRAQCCWRCRSKAHWPRWSHGVTFPGLQPRHALLSALWDIPAALLIFNHLRRHVLRHLLVFVCAVKRLHRVVRESCTSLLPSSCQLVLMAALSHRRAPGGGGGGGVCVCVCVCVCARDVEDSGDTI